jgi:hypothetical protein
LPYTYPFNFKRVTSIFKQVQFGFVSQKRMFYATILAHSGASVPPLFFRPASVTHFSL